MELPSEMKRALARRLLALRARRSPDPMQLDPAQPLDRSRPHWTDSFYFTGASPDGSDLALRLALRGCGHVELWLFFRLPGRGLLWHEAELLPSGDGLAAGPVRLECREPGRRWGLHFSGVLRGEAGLWPARFELEFEARTPVVRYDQLAPDSVAAALAEERWSLTWLRELGALHQYHLEQGGRLRGELELGAERIALDLAALRDRSTGVRDWAALGRHVWCYATLDDGRLVSFSLARLEHLSHHRAGFVVDRGAILSLADATPLAAIAPDGPTPRLDLELTLVGGQRLALSATTEASRRFVMGGCYEVHEGLARFEVDGVPGRGIAELGYRR